MSGWVKLHRKLVNWEWYGDINTCRLFIHCLLRANHSDTKWRGHTIKRGQFLTSLASLCAETGLSVSQTRTSINKLELTGEIASLPQARSRIITVLEYESHQSDSKLNNKIVATESQADRKLIATDKNVKKNKNDKNDKNDIKNIFEYWSMRMNKTNPKLTAKRESCVKARIKDGYTIDQLKLAIDGCANSGYHMGQNDTGTRYDDLTLICRSGDKVEGFIDKNSPILPPGGANGTYQRAPRKLSLAERTQKQSDDFFADIARREANSGPVGAHDLPVRHEVDITHGRPEKTR